MIKLNNNLESGEKDRCRNIALILRNVWWQEKEEEDIHFKRP